MDSSWYKHRFACMCRTLMKDKHLFCCYGGVGGGGVIEENLGLRGRLPF